MSESVLFVGGPSDGRRMVLDSIQRVMPVNVYSDEGSTHDYAAPTHAAITGTVRREHYLHSPIRCGGSVFHIYRWDGLSEADVCAELIRNYKAPSVYSHGIGSLSADDVGYLSGRRDRP